MSEISVRVARRRNAFIYLRDMNILPGNFFIGEGAKHLPRSAAAAYGHDETPARRNRLAGLRGNKLCTCRGRGVGIGVNFNSHDANSTAVFCAALRFLMLLS